MKFGAHVSIAGGIDKAPQRAHQMGCECFQIFSRSPRGGAAPKLNKELVDNFKKECGKYGLESYIHTPYYINLASTNKKIYNNSIMVIREDLERATVLEAKYVMTHLGSAKDVEEKKALDMAAIGLKRILSGYGGTAEFLIEMAAGAGMIIGDTFEEIKAILKKLPKKIEQRVGICFDTQHAFASGYDLRNEKKVKEVFDRFDKILGLQKLKLMHGNDSKTEFASHKDRHAHIGEGFIDKKGFSAVVNEQRLKEVNMVLETPVGGVEEDLEVLKALRGQ